MQQSQAPILGQQELSAHYPKQISNSMSRHTVSATDADILADIYLDTVNMAVWQRTLNAELQNDIDGFLASRKLNHYNLIVPARPDSQTLAELTDYPHLQTDIRLLVEMFSCLFELTSAGLRFTPLRNTMCPKFHVDHVPCRLITTYAGPATQWLEHSSVCREKLGAGSRGLSDEESGLYPCASSIQQVHVGDVALLKGERWEGNEGGGLVHRSPAIANGQQRLLLTLDFA